MTIGKSKKSSKNRRKPRAAFERAYRKLLNFAALTTDFRLSPIANDFSTVRSLAIIGAKSLPRSYSNKKGISDLFKPIIVIIRAFLGTSKSFFFFYFSKNNVI